MMAGVEHAPFPHFPKLDRDQMPVFGKEKVNFLARAVGRGTPYAPPLPSANQRFTLSAFLTPAFVFVVHSPVVTISTFHFSGFQLLPVVPWLAFQHFSFQPVSFLWRLSAFRFPMSGFRF